MNITDDRQTTAGRAIAYSEREREFTFAIAKKTELCNNLSHLVLIVCCHAYTSQRNMHLLKIGFLRISRANLKVFR